MTKSYITIDHDRPRPYWVAVSCADCGRVVGFFEATEEFADDTARRLEAFPYCLKCRPNERRSTKG